MFPLLPIRCRSCSLPFSGVLSGVPAALQRPGRGRCRWPGAARRGLAGLAALLLLLGTGCRDESERLAQLAEKTAQQQAEQNQAMAETSRQALKATEQLIASQEQSRQELVELSRQVQAQQAALEQQQAELLAAQRRWLGRLGMIACGAVLVGAVMWLRLAAQMRRPCAQQPATGRWVALDRARAGQLPGTGVRRVGAKPLSALPAPRQTHRKKRRRRPRRPRPRK